MTLRGDFFDHTIGSDTPNNGHWTAWPSKVPNTHSCGGNIRNRAELYAARKRTAWIKASHLTPIDPASPISYSTTHMQAGCTPLRPSISPTSPVWSQYLRPSQDHRSLITNPGVRRHRIAVAGSARKSHPAAREPSLVEQSNWVARGGLHGQCG